MIGPNILVRYRIVHDELKGRRFQKEIRFGRGGGCHSPQDARIVRNGNGTEISILLIDQFSCYNVNVSNGLPVDTDAI